MTKIAIDQATDVLLIIDAQRTFMPGGGLAVATGHEVISPINALTQSVFEHAVATQDWHPKGHKSFASSHEGRKPFETVRMSYGEQTLWTDHGIQCTAEAEIHPDIDMAKVELIVRKGFRKEIDSYSAFFENDRTTTTGLDGYLTARGFKRVFLTGIATDFCVAYSAEDAARLGYEVFVIEDACRGIGIPADGGKTTIDLAKERLAAMGVKFIASTDLEAA